jgi:hypothetical protein
VIEVLPAATSPRTLSPATESPSLSDGKTVPLPTLLHAIAQAYAAGDAPLGERLFLQALDEYLPWDVVCAAAARGVAARYGEQPRA